MVRFLADRALHFISLPYPNSQGDSLHPRTISGDLQGICRNYKCKDTDNIYIMDFPLLDSAVCFRGISSTTVQGISNIYWRMLRIGVRTTFIFEVRIVTQEFSNFAPPDWNNFITSVSYFLQSRLSLLISTQQCSFSVADGLMSIGLTLTPMPKTP